MTELESLESTIRRVKWERPGNAWRLLVMEDGSTWKGSFPDQIFAGDLVKAEGEWKQDKYGRAFEVERILLHVAKSNDGIMAWLKYRLPNIGDERARALVRAFGGELWNVLENNPGLLTSLPGITPERADEITLAYRTFKREQQIVSKLVDHGLKLGLAMRAFKHYGGVLAEVLERDPYELMDVDGITFDAIDEVARKMGISERDHRRVRAWARAQLESELAHGHCFMPSMKLIGGLTKWGYTFPEATKILIDSPHISIRGGAVLLSRIDYAERVIASKVREMLDRTPHTATPEIPEQLDESQRRATLALVNFPIVIMTGPPGSGKTTTLKTALDIIEAQGERLRLVAPTGKAAKRMATVTGRPAGTMHRLLGWTPDGGWQHSAANPIPADVVVIDEASMVDVSLAASFFEALGDARLIIVGDVKQLPPVGPGQPLYDLMESKIVPTYVLDTIHRQAGDSWVVDNARKIIAGMCPSTEATNDFELEDCSTSDDIVDFVLRLYQVYPEAQILTPEHKNGAGTIRLNNEIQANVNPKNKFAPFAQCGDYRIFENDKVLYTKNNSEKGLVNGDMGRVIRIAGAGKEVTATVEFEDMTSDLHPDGRVELKGGDLSPLTLAYAMTVHKGQGSEWPFVVVIADPEHTSLRRQLVYTAVTRSKDKLAIVGSREALERACRRELDTGRRTLLKERLRETI